MKVERSEIKLYCSLELKNAVKALAKQTKSVDRRDKAMNSFVVRLLAKAVGRPDLAVVPRNRMGRPTIKARPVARRA